MIYWSIFIHLCLISNCILLAISRVVGKLKSMAFCRRTHSAIALPVCRCRCLLVEINIIFFERNGKINALQKKKTGRKTPIMDPFIRVLRNSRVDTVTRSVRRVEYTISAINTRNVPAIIHSYSYVHTYQVRVRTRYY